MRTDPAAGAKVCKLCGQRFTNEASFCPFDGEVLADAPPAWSSPKDPLIGLVLDGRYEVEESLGEGGMGVVYRVRHQALQRHFALKVLRQELAREGELCARFIQEARTAATISHPNVVQITDYGNLPGGSPYFVMEFLSGQSLSRMIKMSGSIPAARAVRILTQIAAGLGAAHLAGIVHRDLKPDNIFVSQDANGQDIIKLLDFGVAKVAGSARMTRTGMVFGSPHYMSPEQASGQPVDHRADIYALGIVMYELFTGRVPFEADTYMGVLTKHMFMAPEPFVDQLGNTKELGGLEDVTLRCLAKKPEDRYPNVEAVIADIDDIVQLGAGDGIVVRPSSTGFATRPSASAFRLADELELPDAYEVSAARARRGNQDARYHYAVAALIAAVLLLVGAIALLLWSRGKSPSVVASPAPQEVASPIAAMPSAPALSPVGSASAEAPSVAPNSVAVAVPATVATSRNKPSGTTKSPHSVAKDVPVAPPPAEPPPPPKPPPGSAGADLIDPWGH